MSNSWPWHPPEKGLDSLTTCARTVLWSYMGFLGCSLFPNPHMEGLCPYLALCSSSQASLHSSHLPHYWPWAEPNSLGPVPSSLMCSPKSSQGLKVPSSCIRQTDLPSDCRQASAPGHSSALEASIHNMDLWKGWTDGWIGSGIDIGYPPFHFSFTSQNSPLKRPLLGSLMTSICPNLTQLTFSLGFFFFLCLVTYGCHKLSVLKQQNFFSITLRKSFTHMIVTHETHCHIVCIKLHWTSLKNAMNICRNILLYMCHYRVFLMQHVLINTFIHWNSTILFSPNFI